eukprot:g1031.t1
MNRFEFESRRRKVSIAIHSAEDTLSEARKHLSHAKTNRVEHISFVSPIKVSPRKFASPDYAFKGPQSVPVRSKSSFQRTPERRSEKRQRSKVASQELSRTNDETPSYNNENNHQLHMRGSIQLNIDGTSKLPRQIYALRANAVELLETGQFMEAIETSLRSLRHIKHAQTPSNFRGAGLVTIDMLPECLLLAKAYTMSGCQSEANAFLERVGRFVEIEPYSDPVANISLILMLADLWLMQGDAQSAEIAEQFYLTYLSKMENHFGFQHVAMSDAHNVLASYYTHVGDLERAANFCHMALKIRLQTIGISHRCTADNHYNLGLLYRL